MKKLYIPFLIIAALLKAGQADAQAGSVTLTPAAGSPVAYPSITSAYAAIPASPGVSYTIDILAAYNGADASEVYPIQLTDKGITPGGVVTITIRPAAGNNGEVIARPVAAAGPVLQMNGGDNIILDGRPGGVASSAANYLSVNDPFVGSNTNRNIELLNAASSNTIKFINCTAANATTGATPAGSRVILIGATTTTANLNNTVDNCIITGGLRGIQDFGQSDLIPNSGSKITNNTVKDFAAIGIFSGTGVSNITITGNTVSMASYNAPGTSAIVAIQSQSLVAGTTNMANNTISLVISSATTTSVTGIADLAVGTENITNNSITALTAPSATSFVGVGTYSNGLTTFNVTGNLISNISGSAATSVIGANLGTSTTPAATTYNFQRNQINGLSSSAVVNARGYSIFPPAGSTLNLYNNFVSITDANGSATAIFGILLGNTAAANYTANVYYNSVRIGGTTASASVNSYGIYKSDANATSNFSIKDNIMVMDRNFGTGFLLANTTGTLALDYNNYYGAGASNSFAAGINTTYYDNTQLAAYKAAAAPQDQNSTFSPVSFFSNTDLHLLPASVGDPNLKGTPIAGITTDIDGATRSASQPVKGADEDGVIPVKLVSFTGLAKDNYNTLSWSTATEENNSGFELQRSADGRNFTKIAFIASKAPNGYSNTMLNYNYNDLQPITAGSFYRLMQVDKDGRGTYSGTVRIKGRAGMELEVRNLYPNPVVDQFSLIVSIAKNSSIAVVITDASGRLMLKNNYAVTNGDNIFNISSSTFGKGVYILKAIDPATGETAIVKFTK